MEEWRKRLLDNPPPCASIFDLEEWEDIVINELTADPSLWGGASFGQLTDEHKENISKTLMGHSVSAETRRKISEAGIGRISSNETNSKRSKSMKGKTHSTQAKQKMREKALNRQHTDETKEKISKAGRGILRSKEFKDNLKEVVKGRIHITNGEINKFVHKENIPEGFWPGRILK